METLSETGGALRARIHAFKTKKTKSTVLQSNIGINYLNVVESDRTG